jgi:hypothetical protein
VHDDTLRLAARQRCIIATLRNSGYVKKYAFRLQTRAKIFGRAQKLAQPGTGARGQGAYHSVCHWRNCGYTFAFQFGPKSNESCGTWKQES